MARKSRKSRKGKKKSKKNPRSRMRKKSRRTSRSSRKSGSPRVSPRNSLGVSPRNSLGVSPGNLYTNNFLSVRYGDSSSEEKYISPEKLFFPVKLDQYWSSDDPDCSFALNDRNDVIALLSAKSENRPSNPHYLPDEKMRDNNFYYIVNNLKTKQVIYLNFKTRNFQGIKFCVQAVSNNIILCLLNGTILTFSPDGELIYKIKLNSANIIDCCCDNRNIYVSAKKHSGRVMDPNITLYKINDKGHIELEKTTEYTTNMTKNLIYSQIKNQIYLSSDNRIIIMNHNLEVISEIPVTAGIICLCSDNLGNLIMSEFLKDGTDLTYMDSDNKIFNINIDKNHIINSKNTRWGNMVNSGLFAKNILCDRNGNIYIHFLAVDPEYDPEILEDFSGSETTCLLMKTKLERK